MSRRPRQKKRSTRKIAQEATTEAQGKNVLITVIVATVLLLIILYFSFRGVAG